jgi:hypothetical protein
MKYLVLFEFEGNAGHINATCGPRVGCLRPLFYSVFTDFGLNLLTVSDLILSLSQFLLLPQQPLKMMLAIKVDKFDSKIIILLPQSKSVKQIVVLVEFNIYSTIKIFNVLLIVF